MNVGILILRLAVGLTVGAHGIQKLTTRLGGHGVAGTSQFVGSLGFRPDRYFAYVLGFAEVIGGLLIAAGLLTPVGALMVIGVMTAAIAVVHWKNGFFVTDGGLEHPFMLGAAAAAVAFTGPGAYSLDAVLGLDLNGTPLAIAAVLLGVLSGLAVSAVRHLPKRAGFSGTPAQTS